MRSSAALVLVLLIGSCGDNLPPPHTAVCGNGVQEEGEVCDGGDLRGTSCTTFDGFTGGSLACSATCDAFVISGCSSAPICGDGAIGAPEACDGTNLGGRTCTSLGYVSGTLSCDATCQLDVSGCSMAPASWTCDPHKYGAGDGCDCGCGVIDRDCPDGYASSCATCDGTGSCSATACPGDVNPSDNTRCLPKAPVGWRCLDDYYFDTTCDCGCGVPDPACASAAATSCDYCDDPGSCSTACPGNIDVANNATCTVPAQWTCSASTYGTGDGCDCGCGSIDPDCTTDLLSACMTCDASGSCGTGACPGNIDPGNITACAP